MRWLLSIFAVLSLSGCPGTLNQVAGTGALYHTRCSATMQAKGEEYHARCTPPKCTQGFTDGPINQVVVALDPGKKVVGYAERICYQDLSDASRLFQTPEPADLESADTPPAEDGDERPPPTQ